MIALEAVTIWLDSGDWPSDGEFEVFCERMCLETEPNGLGLRAALVAVVAVDDHELVTRLVQDEAGHWIYLMATYRNHARLMEVLQDAWDEQREEAANA